MKIFKHDKSVWMLISMFVLSVLLAACAPSIKPGEPMPEEDKAVTQGPSETPAEPTAVVTAEPTEEPEPSLKPDTGLSGEESDTEKPGQEPEVTDVPAPVLKEYGFKYSVDGNSVCPEAVWPDLSVAYTVEEADYTVQPEDIAGMFTKENFPRVDGSTATIPISEAIYQYATGASREEAEQAIVHTKTSQSYYRLFDGESDILIVYEPSDAVVELMKEHPCKIRPIGLDALVFMANSDNPVDSLTMGQLQRIYTGEIENWSEVGGEERPILAFQRPIGTGSQNLIEKVVMGELPMSTGDNVFYYSTMSDILEGMLSYNGDDNTLGYSVFYYAHNMYYLPELRFMAVDGVLPSTQTIYDGSYKLVNPFYAVIREDEPEDSGAHKLFDWLTSDTAQQMMIDLGYVPVNMPENAVFGGEQTYIKGNAEVNAVQELNEGEYFVYYNMTSTNSEGSYGDVIIFDNKWEPVMTFYNVDIESESLGVNTSGVLRISQCRMKPDGEIAWYQGIYDIAAGKYSLEPSDRYVGTCDAELGYFYTVDPDSENYRVDIIDRYGNVLHEDVYVIEAPAFYRYGDVFMEFYYEESEEPDGFGRRLWRVYDLELNLLKVLDEEVDAEEIQTLMAYPADEYLHTDYNINPENPELYRVSADDGIYADISDDGLVLYADGKPAYTSDSSNMWIDVLDDGSILWNIMTDKSISLRGDYAWQEYGWEESENVEVIGLYGYVITKDGAIRWKPDRLMNLRRINGNYVQDFYGDYNTVYDLDGNVIIRKLNNNRALD